MRRLLLTLGALSLMPHGAAMAMPTAREVIEDFYQSYLTIDGDRMKRRPPFSADFLAAEAEDKALCKRQAGDDICGWDADFNPYLNAQDYADGLDFNNADVIVTEPRTGTVNVQFKLFPEAKTDEGVRQVTYVMLKEGNDWVVDDIVYDNGIQGHSARQFMAEETARLKEGPTPE